MGPGGLSDSVFRGACVLTRAGGSLYHRDHQTQVSLQGTGFEPLGLGPSSSVENRACLPPWVAKEKIGFLLLASEMPVPIPRNRHGTVYIYIHIYMCVCIYVYIYTYTYMVYIVYT